MKPSDDSTCEICGGVRPSRPSTPDGAQQKGRLKRTNTGADQALAERRAR